MHDCTRLDDTITEASARQTGVRERCAAAVAMRRGSTHVAQRRHGGGSGTATALRESEGHIESDLRSETCRSGRREFRRDSDPAAEDNAASRARCYRTYAPRVRAAPGPTVWPCGAIYRDYR